MTNYDLANKLRDALQRRYPQWFGLGEMADIVREVWSIEADETRREGQGGGAMTEVAELLEVCEYILGNLPINSAHEIADLEFKLPDIIKRAKKEFDQMNARVSELEAVNSKLIQLGTRLDNAYRFDGDNLENAFLALEEYLE
jgi:hypothetical protein